MDLCGRLRPAGACLPQLQNPYMARCAASYSSSIWRLIRATSLFDSRWLLSINDASLPSHTTFLDQSVLAMPLPLIANTSLETNSEF